MRRRAYKTDPKYDTKTQQLLLILQGLNRPAELEELLKYPFAKGMTGHSLAGHLRVLRSNKQATRIARRQWIATTTAPAASTPAMKTNGNVPTNMKFVIDIQNHQVQLDIGGLRLPVVVE